jgi:serine/threonine protein phosphatase PrpC
MVKTQIRYAGASDPGKVRRNNEDAFHMDADRGIFLVVDGIGGQAAGEEAARIAIERVRARLERQTGSAEQRLREAIAVANNAILNAARGNPAWSGMACVLTAVVLDNGSAVVGHVGDSRLYHIRRGEIRKITHDHSPVGEREDNREIGEAEAMRHPRRNEVYRDVGSEEHAPEDAGFIEIARVPFEPDSALLLCSDGLSDQVPSAAIRSVVERNAGRPEGAVRELIESANKAGGKDNVTVLVVEGERFAAAPAVEPEVAGRRRVLAPAAWFLGGAAVALAALWLSRPLWMPAPVVIAPRVLAVGAGARFDTITAALAEARPGDTVEVAGGEYREMVRLKDGVALRSVPPREAILRVAAMSTGPAVEADEVRGARLSGFRILADTRMPLSAGIVLNNSQVEVDDNEIAGAGIGVAVRGSASPALRGNVIHDCAAEGVLILGPSRPWLSNNVIQRNKGAGVAARDGAQPVLAGNLFEKNGLELPNAAMDAVRERNFFPDTARPARPRSTSTTRREAPAAEHGTAKQ